MNRFMTFDTHNGDSQWNERTGRRVEVLRELTEAEADIADVGKMFCIRFEDGVETDAFEDELVDPMAAVKAYRLPGFYTDERGAYGVIVGKVYICCFVNSEDGKYDVTADTLDANGDFALNLDWESYDQPEDAVKCLRRLLRKHTGGKRL